MPDSNYLKRIGYQKRSYTQNYEECAHCAYFDRTNKYDDHYCNKHRMIIGVYDICRDYYDLMETPEGKRAGAIWRQMASDMDVR